MSRIKLAVCYTFIVRLKVCLINYSEECLAQSRPCPSWHSWTHSAFLLSGHPAERMCSILHSAGRESACTSSSGSMLCPARCDAYLDQNLARVILEEIVSTNAKKIITRNKAYSTGCFNKNSVIGYSAMNSHFMVS